MGFLRNIFGKRKEKTVPDSSKALNDSGESNKSIPIEHPSPQQMVEIENPQIAQVAAIHESPKLESPEQARLDELMKKSWCWNENDKNEILGMGKLAIGPLLNEVVSSNKDFSVRKKYANLLIKLADESILDPLVNALKSSNYVTRDAAGIVLEEMGSLAFEPLIALLGKGPSYAQSKAMEILVKLGDKRAIEPISNIFSHFVAMNINSVSEEGYNAGYALGNLKAASAVDILVQGLLHPDFKLRRASAKALGQIGDPRAINALTKATIDEDEFVCDIAKKSLEQIAKAD